MKHETGDIVRVDHRTTQGLARSATNGMENFADYMIISILVEDIRNKKSYLGKRVDGVGSKITFYEESIV